MFPVEGPGTLGEALFQDGGAGSPWFPIFLHSRHDSFVIGYAVGDGLALATIDTDGKVTPSQVVHIDTSGGVPTELCWLSVSPDDRLVGVRDQLRRRLPHQLPDRRQRPVGRQGPCLPQGSGRRHVPSPQQHGEQRVERQLALTRRSLPLPDLRERLEAGRVTVPPRRLARGGHACGHPLQRPSGPRRLLSRPDGGTHEHRERGGTARRNVGSRH